MASYDYVSGTSGLWQSVASSGWPYSVQGIDAKSIFKVSIIFHNVGCFVMFGNEIMTAKMSTLKLKKMIRLCRIHEDRLVWLTEKMMSKNNTSYGL